MSTTEDKIARAMEQGKAQMDSIFEMVAGLDADESEKYYRTQSEIEQSVLEVSVRSGWCPPGTKDFKPAEYCIVLLSTGGPAVRIVGELSEHFEPTSARLEIQDWFIPWTEWRPPTTDSHDWQSALLRYASRDWQSALLRYARCFYFGRLKAPTRRRKSPRVSASSSYISPLAR